jgi:hypothetical protein
MILVEHRLDLVAMWSGLTATTVGRASARLLILAPHCDNVELQAGEKLKLWSSLTVWQEIPEHSQSCTGYNGEDGIRQLSLIGDKTREDVTLNVSSASLRPRSTLDMDDVRQGCEQIRYPRESRSLALELKY